MKKVFIVHGFNGEPNSGWKPWLMGELAKKDIYACALLMPSPDHPIKKEWVRGIKDAVKKPDKEIFLVGHSLGVPAILRYLETLNRGSRIGGAVLVSGPAFKIEKDKYKQVNKFLDTPFDFNHIKKVCKNFVIIHGDNDKNVPFSDAEYLRDKLSCKLISVHNGGHLSSWQGWNKLPQVLEALLKIMK